MHNTTMKHRRQVVIDTNVVVAAFRSKQGASFKLIQLVGKGKFEINLSVPLVLEYEQASKRSEWPGKPPWKYISDILDYLCLEGRQRDIHFLWRPREKDPKDDMVLEVAVAGTCDCIITFNKHDFTDAHLFGLELLTPQEFLRKTGEIP